MLKPTIVILLLLQIGLSFSQTNNNVLNFNGSSTINIVLPTDLREKIKNFESISHKMYISKNFLESKVDKINQSFALRYNLFSDEMEFIKNNEINYLNKDKIKTIIFTNSKDKYVVYNYNDKLRYFCLLLDNEKQLLVKQSVKYKEATPAKSSYESAKPADFVRNDDVFFLRDKDSGKMIELPRNKRKFFEVFESKSKEIKQFVKQEKLNIRDKKDLVTVVEFYNSINK